MGGPRGSGGTNNQHLDDMETIILLQDVSVNIQLELVVPALPVVKVLERGQQALPRVR